MPTQEEKKSPTPEPTREQGVRALLTDIIPGDAPLTPEQLQTSREYCLRNALEKDGVYVFSYTFDAQRPVNQHNLAENNANFTNIENLNSEQRDKIRAELARIEKVANLQFVEADSENVDKAHLRIFSADTKEKDVAGQASFGGSIRDVIIDKKNGFNPLVILHEIGHALGLSHPNANRGGEKAGGHTEGFTKDTTLMSYNSAQHSFTPPGLGYLDVAALQLIYGEPKKSIHPDGVINSTVLLEERYLYDNHPLTLDLRGPTDGMLTIDDKKITGHLHKEPRNTKDVELVNAYMVRDKQIKDVLADNDTRVTLTLTGNDLPNRLQGGIAHDTLTPRGGNDIITANGGLNTVVLNDKSGFDNVITDYNAAPKYAPGDRAGSSSDFLREIEKTFKGHTDKKLSNDNRLNFGESITQITLSGCDGLVVQGENFKGTKILCADKEGKAVASVLVADVDPKQLETDIRDKHMRSFMTQRFGKITYYDGPPITVVPESDSSTQHPSGLPNLPPAGEKKRER